MSLDGSLREADAGAESTDSRATGLRVLCDVGHPAQVHLFRNALAELDERGAETFVTSREKEVTVDLLDAYGIDHRPLTTRGDSMPALIGELALREWRLLQVAREFDPDVIVGRPNPAAAHVSALVGAENVAVCDTHIDSAPIRLLYHRATFPFVDAVCAPPSLDLPVAADKRESLGFQELAYLHPDYFDPDPNALREHGIDPDEPFYVIRVAGWDAYHDVGHAGLSPDGIRELVEFLSDHGSVYISAEGELPADLETYRLPTDPEDVHDVLAFADLYVGDSGTMSTEAALLGTPAVRTNSMAGPDDESVFRDLEQRYDLLQSFADERRAIAEIERLVGSGIDRGVWQRRRERLVDEQPDVTERIVETILESGARGADTND